MISIRTETAAPAVRMAGVQARTTVRYLSSRVVHLTRELEGGQFDAWARFWAGMRAARAPLVEPFDGRVNAGPGAGPSLRLLADDRVLRTSLCQHNNLHFRATFAEALQTLLGTARACP